MMRMRFFWMLMAMLLAGALPSVVQATTPQALLAEYVKQSGQPAQPVRGETFFKQNHQQEWQCTSCHGKVPTQSGRHASTDKPIEPLAPAANAKRFTDVAKVEKWFRRNCKDVLARECTAAEKADVLAWLITLK